MARSALCQSLHRSHKPRHLGSSAFDVRYASMASPSGHRGRSALGRTFGERGACLHWRALQSAPTTSGPLLKFQQIRDGRIEIEHVGDSDAEANPPPVESAAPPQSVLAAELARGTAPYPHADCGHDIEESHAESNRAA